MLFNMGMYDPMSLLFLRFGAFIVNALGGHGLILQNGESTH